jgi:hypothetical protein
MKNSQRRAMFAKGDKVRYDGKIATVIKTEKVNLAKNTKENIVTIKTKSGHKFVGYDSDTNGSAFTRA